MKIPLSGPRNCISCFYLHVPIRSCLPPSLHAVYSHFFFLIFLDWPFTTTLWTNTSKGTPLSLIPMMFSFGAENFSCTQTPHALWACCSYVYRVLLHWGAPQTRRKYGTINAGLVDIIFNNTQAVPCRRNFNLDLAQASRVADRTTHPTHRDNIYPAYAHVIPVSFVTSLSCEQFLTILIQSHKTLLACTIAFVGFSNCNNFCAATDRHTCE